MVQGQLPLVRVTQYGFRVAVWDLPVVKVLAEKSGFNFLFIYRTSCYVSLDGERVLRAALSLESVCFCMLGVFGLSAGCSAVAVPHARGLVGPCFGPCKDGPGPLALELQAHFKEHSANT